MPRKFNARRYAQAVFEIARERNEFELWQNELERLSAMVADAALLAVLQSPRVKFADKTRLLEERLRGASPLALNLAKLLVIRGGLGMVGTIAAEYQRRLDEHRGIQTAEVTTAIPLGGDDEAKIAEKLSGMVGKKVVVKPRVNPAILGGLIARLGGKLLDGSTRCQLAALRKALAGGH